MTADMQAAPLTISFTVHGIPVPQGSMFAFTPRGWSRPIITSANPKLKKWRAVVKAEAVKAIGWEHPAGRHVPLRVDLNFFLEKAKSNKCLDAVKKPDLDKLIRGCLDSMTKVIYDDDAQIIELHVAKFYGVPRVEIRVEEIGVAAVPYKGNHIEDAMLPF